MANRFENPSYDAAFDRCIDVLAQLIIKYGPTILERQKQQETAVCIEESNPCRKSSDIQQQRKSSA